MRKIELARRVQGLQDIIQFLDERWQIHIQDIPKDVEIDGIIAMDETIASKNNALQFFTFNTAAILSFSRSANNAPFWTAKLTVDTANRLTADA